MVQLKDYSEQGSTDKKSPDFTGRKLEEQPLPRRRRDQDIK